MKVICTLLLVLFIVSSTSAQEGPFVPCVGCENLAGAPFPKSGLWHNPEQSPGSGFNFEIQNGVLAGFFYGYSTQSKPEWQLVSGTLVRSEVAGVLWELETTLIRAEGGSCIDCEFTPPDQITEGATIRLEFMQRNYMRISIGGVFDQFFVPFTYGSVAKAYFPNNSSYLLPEFIGTTPFMAVLKPGDKIDQPGDWGSSIFNVELTGIVQINGVRTLRYRMEVYSPTYFIPDPPPRHMGNIDCQVDDLVGEPGCHVIFTEFYGSGQYVMPIGNLGSSSFFAEAEDGSTIEAFRIVKPVSVGNSEPGLFTQNTIIVEGITRTYDYYVPSELGPSLSPLVFLLHGGDSKSADLTGESGFKAPYKIWMDIAEEEKIILIYPNGTNNPLGAQGWNDCRTDATTNPAVNDVNFIDALIGYFSNSYNIDTNRVYATGTSNGGHMSLRLALELSNKIAAIAPVVASMPANRCSDPVNPVSVLFILGTDDPLSPYSGGEIAPGIGGRGIALSAEESVNFWVVFNQTDSVPSITNYPDINSMDNSTVKSNTYSNGTEGTEVALYEVLGGGHLEPSIQEQYSAILELYLGRQNHDIEMATEVWGFFKNKTLN